MKVLHLLTTSHFSGAENVVCQIIEICHSENCKMIYCSPDGQIRDALKERNIDFEPLKNFSSKEIARVIGKVMPNIIHAHDMRASYMASKVNRNIPIISHIHNNGYDARSLSKKTLGYLWASRRISKIFWVSKSALNDFYFKKIVKKKSIVLSNILDLDKLALRASEAYTDVQYDIVFLGRLQYPKNPMRFVDVINKLVKQNPDVKAAIIGDGEQRSITVQKIQELHLQNNITLLGFISNPLGILKNAKALVMTSFWEGTPMSSLEALGLGIPVVSTPVDGLKDIIINENNGYLSNSNDVLASQLHKIISNPIYHRQLTIGSLNSARIINNKEKYSNIILHSYRELIDSN